MCVRKMFQFGSKLEYMVIFPFDASKTNEIIMRPELRVELTSKMYIRKEYCVIHIDNTLIKSSHISAWLFWTTNDITHI